MSKGKILVVDDDKNLLHGLAVHLEANDHEVLLATNVNTAVNTARRKKVDLIVLDLELPDGSGYDVIDRLRIEQPRTEYRVIVLSAREEATFNSKPLKASVLRFFQKPVDIYQLVDVIVKSLPAAVEYSH